MSTYEDDLRVALKTEFDTGQIREVGDAAAVLSALSKEYPVRGSKIDWRHVPGAVEFTEKDESLQQVRFEEFFDEIYSKFNLVGPVIYAGDSATDFALEGTVEVIRRVLPILIDIPQHHYFIGPGSSWCMCLTMEGDMGFGCAAKSFCN